MKGLLALLAVLLAASVASLPAAAAPLPGGCHYGAGATSSVFTAQTTCAQPSGPTYQQVWEGDNASPTPPPPPLYVAGVAGGCLGDPEVCTPDVDPATPITQVTVLRALRRIDLPASRLVVQPPGGKTLVNFDTLFRTEAEPFTRTVRLVGHRVDLEITPSSFTWRHGDGTAQTTASPGRAFRRGVPMEEYVSHRYEDAHVTMRPAVDTTYSARFRVDGGPWRDVDGTVTISGSGVDLRVVEGRPTLVGAY